MNREIKFKGWEYFATMAGTPSKIIVFPNGYKQHGYVKRKAPNHPYCDKRGYVMEHRLVVEGLSGVFLPKHAVIHHKNGVRDDNSPENLEYIEGQEKHAESHDSGKRNPNGQFVAVESIFSEIKFRLFNKNTKLIEVHTLGRLIATTFRRSQFEFRGRFTGLKDKNGLEIYENDVVKGGVYYNSWENDIGIVKFGEFESDNSGDEYGHTTCYGWFVHPIKGIIMQRPEYTDRKFAPEALEVIGNIYSNPELLNNL